MTRRVSKRGITYTAGSHQSWEGFPRVCYRCGEKVVMKRHHVWQETLLVGGAWEKRSWHMACRLEQVAA